MGYIHVAAVDESHEPVLAAVREMGAEKVIIVTSGDEPRDEIDEVLEPLGVATEHREAPEQMLLGTVQLLQDIVREHPDRKEDIVVNLGGASRYQACAFLTAAFVAGVRTLESTDDGLDFLPVLNFSYDEVVGDIKLEILQALSDLGGEADDLSELASRTDLDSSTVSYEIRGGREAKGLEELDLVEIDASSDGGVRICATPMGKLLAQGMRLGKRRV